MGDHGGSVAHVPQVERMMLPGRAVVRADPGHVHGRVKIPFPPVPENHRIGQLTILFPVSEKPPGAGIRRAMGHAAGENTDGIIGNRQRIAKGAPLLGGVQGSH